jgi:hypothetical protein
LTKGLKHLLIKQNLGGGCVGGGTWALTNNAIPMRTMRAIIGPFIVWLVLISGQFFIEKITEIKKKIQAICFVEKLGL